MKVTLKQFLQRKHPDESTKTLKYSLEQGNCLVNGKIERFITRKIDPAKDKVSFKLVKKTARAKLTIKKELIIYEDDYFIAYNKEPLFPCLNTSTKASNLHQAFIDTKEYSFIEPVHRLDKDTSGVIIFSKNKEISKYFFELFEEKKITKTYEALIDGLVSASFKQTIDNELVLLSKSKHFQKWGVKKADSKIKVAKRAITKVELIKTYPDKNYSLVKLAPQTGRTHQLRVHMEYLKHPILGDSFYAERFNSKVNPRRHMLHARSLTFLHPITKEKLTLTAPHFKDFKELL
jgi:RluA family pseudouridine synthase